MNIQGRVHPILDDDFSHAYIPSAQANSRSRSMKKLIKKTNSNVKSPPKQKNDLDLLDELLCSQKFATKKEKSTKKQKNQIDSDYFLDENTFNKSRFNISNNESKPISIANSGNLINDKFQSRLGFKQPELEKKEPTPQQTFRKSQDSPSIRPSSRQMKPPLRKRQKTQKSNLNISQKLTLFEDQEQFTSKKSSTFTPELNKRRSSIEQKTELKIDHQKANKLVSLQKFDKKQEGSMKYDIKILEPENIKNSLDLQNKNQLNTDHPANTNQSLKENSHLKNNDQLEKQLEFFKKSYQKHIQQLQSNLLEQVKINKETRAQIMKEADELIDIEKSRLEKLHAEELARVKQMLEWERKRVEENYQDQIQSLKKQLELMSSFANGNRSCSVSMEKRELCEAEEKMRMQRQFLAEREKGISERQLNLEARQRQLERRVHQEEERLRELHHKILSEESQIKKRSLDERRTLEKEKQSVAVELTNLQLEHQKKNQKLEQALKELEVEKEQFEKERQLSRNLSHQIIQNYQEKQLQLNEDKRRTYQLESQLRSNIQIVQAMRIAIEGEFAKESNGTNDDKHVKRVKSVNKILHKKKLESTKDRFYTISQNIKENLRNQGNGGKFDIDKYMAGMSKYSRNINTWV